MGPTQEPFPKPLTAASGRDRGFIGRTGDLDVIRGAVSRGAAGHGGLLLVCGEAGIGKTRLLEETAAEVDAAGTRVVWSTCWETGSSSPFWPWLSVLRQCPSGDSGVLTAESTLEAAAADVLDHRRVEWFEKLGAFFGAVARRSPLMVVIDDLHLADASSIALLRFLAGSLRRDAITIAATYRYPDFARDSALAASLAQVTRTGQVHQLNGLPEDAVARLIRSTVGSPVDDRLAAQLTERTGGNPLFVIETARLLSAQRNLRPARGPLVLPMPETVRQVVSERLAYVSGSCLRLLGDASVLGEELDVGILRQLSQVDEAQLQSLVDEATDAALVHRPEPGVLQFSHAIIREVLYAGIPASERRPLHRAAAEALATRSGEDRAADIADHLFLALPDVDASVVVDACRQAGEASLRALGYEQAALHFRRALELNDPREDGVAVELWLSLGEALMRSGEWGPATDAYEQAAELARRRGRGDELARAALGMGAGLSGFEVRLHDRRQLDLLHEAMRTLSPQDVVLRAWVQARLSVAASFVEPVERRVELSREAIKTAGLAGDKVVLGYALASYCDAFAGPAHSEERLATTAQVIEAGVTAANPELELLGRRLRVVALLEMGDIAAMADEINAFAAVARGLHQPLFRWCVPVWRGTLALLAGRLDDSERLCAQAQELGERAGSTNAALVVAVQGMQRQVERGAIEDVLVALLPFLDDPEGGPNAEAWLVLPLALLGRRAEAQAVLDRLAAHDFPLVADGAWLEVIAGLAEGCAELCDANAAARLYQIIEPYADRFATGATGGMCLGSLHRHLGLLAHTRGLLDLADDHFRHAMKAHQRAGAALLIAHTRRQHAAVLRDRGLPGDADEAARMTRAALAAYREFGITRWAGDDTDVAVDAATPSSPVPTDCFSREGQLWNLTYNGVTVHMRHAKGLAVLAQLLRSPHREFHVLDLIEPPARPGSIPQVSDGLHAPGDLGEVLDPKARTEYRQRLIDLDHEIDEATNNGDTDQVARLKVERDFLTDELSAALGLGGRSRTTGDPTERARWTVTKQVHHAIARIRETHPALGRHLRASVRTGRFCSYEPERPVNWRVG